MQLCFESRRFCDDLWLFHMSLDRHRDLVGWVNVPFLGDIKKFGSTVADIELQNAYGACSLHRPTNCTDDIDVIPSITLSRNISLGSIHALKTSHWQIDYFQCSDF